jgi:hypothetical protein
VGAIGLAVCTRELEHAAAVHTRDAGERCPPGERVDGVGERLHRPTVLGARPAPVGVAFERFDRIG